MDLISWLYVFSLGQYGEYLKTAWRSPSAGRCHHARRPVEALPAANYGDLREQIRGQLTKFTDRTITSINRLDQDVAATKARVYAVDSGEYRDRIESFGAAINFPNRHEIAALGVSVPDVNLEGGKQATICESVRRAANTVNEVLSEQ